MIHVVESKYVGVVRCRVVHVHAKWTSLDRYIFEFVDEFQKRRVRKSAKIFPTVPCLK